MTEDNFEEFLKKTAQSYNVPPVRVPREEMWESIQAKRSAGPRLIYGGGSAMDVSSERRFGSRIWMGVAAAAVLLLATGVGIGRWSASSSSNPASIASRPPAAISTFPDSPQVQSTRAEPQGAAAVASNRTPREGTETSPRETRTPSGGSREVATNGANGGNDRTVTSVPLGGPSGSGSSSAYQLTAVRHLSEAEALLTSFRTRSTTDQQMDAQLGTWARELLSKTRLLLDSPVASDPQRRPLLEDLELVLVQIVQLSPGNTPQDRELIEKTLQQDHVMTRLRTAIPAGPQRGS